MKTNYETEGQGALRKKNEPRVFKNPISKYTSDDNLGIEKISLNDDFTKIDFVYISPRMYPKGGWIHIESGCFIRAIGSDIRYNLLQAVNVPLAPDKYYFESCSQVYHFSLIFPGIPKHVQEIDFIENLAEGTYFNFFKVSLQHTEPTPIQITLENRDTNRS